MGDFGLHKQSQIERLPFVIFPIIQSYLMVKDYGNLMNCNSSTFKEIKFATIHFHFVTTTHQDDESRESIFLKLQTQVKDPSKQISMTLYNLPNLTPEYLNLTRPPFTLTVQDLQMEDVNFNLFNNIHHVCLQNFPNVQRISSGLQNVKILEIALFPELTEICNINQSKTLESITILMCEKCSLLNFPMDNVTKVIIDGTSMTHLPPIPKLQHLSFYIEGSRIPIPSDILQLLLLPSIQSSELEGILPYDCDFRVFQNVPNLTMHYRKPTFLSPTPFLPFYGTHLSLIYANLSFWFKSSFSFLRRLKLSCCRGAIDFASMQNLNHLIIIDHYELNFIPTLPKLCLLFIKGCDQIKISPHQPSLHTLEILDCTSNLPNLSNQTMRSLVLKNSTINGNISIGKVVRLEIFGCNGIT